MPLTSFNVEPLNPQAIGGACTLRITFKIPPSETIHAFGLFVEDSLVGRVADQAGLKAGTYSVACDLAKLGDGPQLVIARAYRVPATDPVYESPPFTVIVSGVGEPAPEPAPVVLNVTTRGVVGRGKPEVLCTMVDEDGAPLSDAPWVVSVEVDGRPGGGVEVHGAQSRFVPAEALAEGLRRVEFKVTSPTRPGHETRVAIPVLVDLRPPLVEVEALAAVTNDTTPRLHVRARDLGTGVDPESLTIAVDGKPYPVIVNPLDAQLPPAPISPPPSPLPVCGSTEATVATLKAEVARLEANPRAMKRLNMMLDSVQEALSGNYNAVARERLGRLIAAVTEMSQSGPATGGIEVAPASSLICGASNLLTAIPLPTGALLSPRTSSPITTTTELKQRIAAADAAEPLRKALGTACDAIQEMISRQRRWRARERTAHLIQQVIQASNAPAGRNDRLSLPSANHVLAGTANVLIGIPLPDRGATLAAIEDLKARIAALHASKPAAASLVNALDSIQRALDGGRPAVACREAGELFADLMSRSRGGRAANDIPGAAVDTLIDPMMGFLSMVVSLATDGSPAASASMVATLPELRTELDLWQPAPEATRALRALLEKAERARTADDTGELRASLGRFVADLAARAVMPADSRERISGAEAMSLAGGAGNVLLGRVAWKRFEVRLAEALPDGEHRFSVSIADRAGNRSQVVEQTILVDTQPPRVGKVVPEPGAVVAARGLSVEVHVSDEAAAGSGARKSSGVASVTLLVDGVDRSATATRAGDVWTWVPPAALAEGDHSLELAMVDRAGNQDRFRSSFSVDATAPVISEVLPPAGSYSNTESVLVFARLTDRQAGLDPRSVRLFVDGNDVTEAATVAPDSVSFVLERAEERAHAVRIECADLVGNHAGATEFQFVVDRTPPRVAIDPSIDELVVPATQMRVSGSVSEPAAVEVNGHAATVEGLTFTVEVPLQTGHNRLAAKAVDNAGNETISPSVDVYRITDREAAVTGVVRDEGDRPVVGVVVVEPRTGISAVSNELGRFALVGLPAGEFLLQVDPGRAAGDRYASFRVQVRTRYGQITAFDTPIYLVPSALEQGTSVPETSDGTTIRAVNDPEMAIVVQGDRVSFPDGVARKIALRSVPSDRLPVDAPEFLPKGPVAILEPSGVTVSGGGAQVTLPNTFGMDADAILPLVLFNSETGAWQLGGFGRVSADARRVVSLPGMGIRHFSMVAAAPLGPRIEPLREENQIPGADALKGALEQRVDLPSFRVNDKVQAPALVYSSMTAAPTLLITGVFQGMREFAGTPELRFDSQTVGDGVHLQAQIQTTVRRESGAWPEAITSRYFFSDIETGEFTLQGPPAKRGPAPPLGVADTRESFPTLPESLALTYLLTPTLADGTPYPTGLYNFLARYTVKGRTYEKVQMARVASSLLIDPEWRRLVAEQAARFPGSAATDLLDKVVQIERMQRPSADVSIQYRYSGLLDYLFQDDAGCVVIHDLSRSPFGRGWRLEEVQEVHPLGRARVLVTGPEGRQVFTVRHTIQALSPGRYGAIALASDGQTVVGASVKPDRTPGGTVSGPGYTLTLPAVTRTDNYVSYQRQWLSNDVYRTVSVLILLYTYQEWQWHGFDSGWHTFYVFGWVPSQEYDHTDHYWSEWSKVSEGVSRIDVQPQVAGMAVASDNTLYVSDRATHRIFRVSPEGEAVAIAGRMRIVDDRPSEQPSAQDRIDHAWSGEDISPGFTPDHTPAAGCQLDAPGGLALDPTGGLLFAETGAHRVRRLNFDTGLLETVAGTGGATYDPGATVAACAALPSPTAIACSAAGEVFVLLNLPGGAQAIGMVDRNGNYHHVVGDAAGTLDTGVDARRYRLVGAEHIAIGDTGRLFISVPAQNVVLVVDGGIIEPVAGSGEDSAAAGDGGPALSASLIRPRGIALTPAGSLVVADTGDGDGHGAVRLVNLGLDALGWTELQGPTGYFGSTLRREPDGTWTRRYRDDSVAHFDATGRHLSMVDRNGNEVGYTYDESNRLVKVSYPRGASLSLRYSAGGTIEAITDHTQRVTTFTVERADLRQVELPDGARRSFTYDGAGRMVAQTDGLGVSTVFAYNDYGRLVARTCADQTVRVERPDDLAVGNGANGKDPIIAETSQTRLVAPDQTQTSYCIENGRMTEVASVNGDTMKTSYGANGLPVEITRPNNKTIRVVYNDYGDVLEARDEALQTVETYEYDARGHKTAYVDAVGRPNRWEYDAAGNLVEAHIGQSSVVTSYAYDAQGMVTRKVEGGVTATFEYDDRGNPSRESRGSWEIHYERDAAGNLTAKTEGADRRTGYRYDALNRLVEADEPRGKTAYRYDGAGRLTEVVDPRGGVHRFEFDARGNTTKKVDPAGRTWAYEYNASDQVVLEIAPDGIRFEHSHDNQRRMQTIVAPGMKLEQAQCQEGSLLWARTESAELRNHFDAKGQYVAQEIRLPVGRPVTLRFQLDLAGKRTAVSCLKNVVTYRYDDAGTLVEIEAGALGVTLERDEGGRVTRATRRNGVSTSVRFNGAGHANEIVETGPGDAATRWTAVFDPAGDCSHLTTADAAWQFEYDGMGQLVRASRDRGNLVLEYQYDALGNRISGPEGASQYDEHGLVLVENAGWVYRHDVRGRLVEKTSKANPQERHLFEYDVSSQLIGYRREDGGATAAVTARYAFDPTGRRIGKQVEYRDQPEKNQVLWWIYDGDNVFLELDGDFNVRRQYVYAQEVDSAIGFFEGGRAYYFARGHLGSIDRVYDDQGEVVARYEYDPFGNLLSEEGTIVNRIRFTGREWDEESGTYHYRARQYDPGTGRFLQPDSQKGDATDPLTFINHYLYCRNSPLRYVDPYGLSWLSDAWDAVSGAVSWVWDKVAWAAAVIVAVVVVVAIVLFTLPLLPLMVLGVVVVTGVLATGVFPGVNGWTGWAFATIPFRAILGLGVGLAVGIHEMLTGGSFSEGFKRGWRVGTNLIPTLKWEQHDGGTLTRRLEGTFRKNYLNDSVPPNDGDERILIEPSTDSRFLLVNQSGTFNEDWQIECEVDIPSDFKSTYHEFISHQVAGEGHVVAQGVWVDDAGHYRKTELHPLDMLVADIAPAQWPLVPAALNIQQSLVQRLGEASMLVYRLLASGDNSPYLHPPLSDRTRTVETWVALPPAPSVPGTSLRVSAEEIAGTHSTPWLTRVDQGAGRLYIAARLASFMDRGGPSVLFADIVVYWDT